MRASRLWLFPSRPSPLVGCSMILVKVLLEIHSAAKRTTSLHKSSSEWDSSDRSSLLPSSIMKTLTRNWYLLQMISGLLVKWSDLRTPIFQICRYVVMTCGWLKLESQSSGHMEKSGQRHDFLQGETLGFKIYEFPEFHYPRQKRRACYYTKKFRQQPIQAYICVGRLTHHPRLIGWNRTTYYSNSKAQFKELGLFLPKSRPCCLPLPTQITYLNLMWNTTKTWYATKRNQRISLSSELMTLWSANKTSWSIPNLTNTPPFARSRKLQKAFNSKIQSHPTKSLALGHTRGGITQVDQDSNQKHR